MSIGAFVIGLALLSPGHRAAPKVSFLMFDGCPNSPMMKSRLLSAMKGLHLKDPQIVDILKLPKTDLRAAYGAPTVLVNGKDLFGLPAPHGGAAACRLYRDGVPTEAEIRERLRKALR
jgi:hypothetical protein